VASVVDVGRGQPVRVLFADDDDAFRHMLRVRLEVHPGLAVVGEARDGQEALAQALTARPDIALLDIEMPRLSGFDAGRAIRAALPDTRIYLHTGEYTNENIARASQHGLDVLDKLKLDETLGLIGGSQAHDVDGLADRLATIRLNLARVEQAAQQDGRGSGQS
jgi:CheY-like chemotaxis protein